MNRLGIRVKDFYFLFKNNIKMKNNINLKKVNL
jgi:hypothetical protein